MIKEKDLFVMCSAIMAGGCVFNQQQRFLQTIQTLESLKTFATHYDVAILEISDVGLDEDYQKKLADFSNVKFFHLYENQEINVVNNSSNPSIIGDKNLISELFRGLIDNGIKYSNAKKIELLIDQTNTKIIITVRDYGIGILESEKQEIFKSHYRGKNVQKNHSGNGLGLSIIKEILDLHEASIELKNRKNGLDVILSFSLN